MTARWMVGLALAVIAARAEAQVRAGVVGAPTVGKAAPELVLPYFGAAGPGPIDQPFRLGAELGRVVVVIFGPAADSARWRSVGASADSSWGKAVVAGVLRAPSGVVADRALAAGSARLKLLADSTGRGRRRFGALGDGWTVFVVDDAGRVALRTESDPTVPAVVANIAAAIDRSRPRY